MPYIIYHKAKATSQPRAPKHALIRLLKLFPSVLITLGSVIIANIAWPFLKYQLADAQRYQRIEFISPIPPQYQGVNPDPSTLSNGTSDPEIVLGAALDYTDPKIWFPAAGFNSQTIHRVKNYWLHIPKLDIDSAIVTVDGEDLSQGLIQYPGTANPGHFGSPVIFGHSVLRQFYNPSITNPNRYVSIFSKIMTLDTGDRIFIDYDGIKYTYEVSTKTIVNPEDLFILEQRPTAKELKLVTCVPEGTYLQRGIITARLIDIAQ
jgi:LPXTG-site transpeptidase (sortase) family protein